ncbi:MAG TPA: BON domain-containing protein [Blastocatellia bacterium]
MARKYDDDRIRADVIIDRLVDDTDLDASDIKVGVDDGAVTLSGSVNSLWDKRRAEDIAKSVPGVKSVNNKLRASMASQITPIEDNRR